MTLEGVMTLEREGIMAEYLFPQCQVPPYSAIPDFDVLRRTPSMLRARYPVTIEELSRKGAGQAFVQTCSGLNYKFLWAHVDNDNYRDDYAAFIQKHHRMHVGKLPDGYHVDHLFNRARARALQLPYVRMVLLTASINTSHGAGYERSRTRGGIGTPGRQRGIDEIVLMKLLGVHSPRQGAALTPQMEAHLNHMASLFGIARAELERNVHELMGVAALRSTQ